MFEQSLFGPETVEQPLDQEGALFGQYEIKTWEFSSRIYKVLGASAIVNVLALLVFAQTSLLTMKGCDSPLVGSVCQALDTVYVGSLLFGTDREFVDASYERTDLGEAEIIYVDVSGEVPPLSYPEGYFAIANPEEYQAKLDAMNNPAFPNDGFLAPGIPAFPNSTPMQIPRQSGGLLDTKPNPPKAKADVVEGELLDIDGNPIGGKPGLNKRRPGGDKANANVSERNPVGSIRGFPGTANTNTTANANVDPNANKPDDQGVEDRNGISINKRPLKDKAVETLTKLDEGIIKLDKTFRVVITGTLGLAKDGKTIVLKDPKPEEIDKTFRSDPALKKLAQEWVLAVGDAGWYGYLGVMDEKKGVGRKVVITIEQNDTTFLANLRSEQPTPDRANTTATSLYNLMTLGALAADGDELTFLKSTKTSSDGKFLVVNFEMPKPQVQEIIQRKLAKTKEEKTQPNSTAGAGPRSNSEAK